MVGCLRLPALSPAFPIFGPAPLHVVAGGHYAMTYSQYGIAWIRLFPDQAFFKFKRLDCRTTV